MVNGTVASKTLSAHAAPPERNKAKAEVDPPVGSVAVMVPVPPESGARTPGTTVSKLAITRPVVSESTALIAVVAAALKLCETSANLFAATETLTVAAVAVTVSVAWVVSTMVNVPAVPPSTVISSLVNASAVAVPSASLKVKVKVTVLPEATEVIATVGATVSSPSAPPQPLKNKLAASAQAVRDRYLAVLFMLVSPGERALPWWAVG